MKKDNDEKDFEMRVFLYKMLIKYFLQNILFFILSEIFKKFIVIL